MVVDACCGTTENPGTNDGSARMWGGLHVSVTPSERESSPRASDRSMGNSSFVAGDETAREVAVRRLTDGALREAASQKR